MLVRDVHSASLAKSTALSGFYMPNAIPPIDVIAVLNQAGVRFMLIGAHALGGWTKKPRATEDVDVVVAARNHQQAIAALLTAFPHLQVDDHPVVTRLRDAESRDVAVDLIKPIEPLFREALNHTHWVESGEQRYQIPSLEMALAMKFASMISLNRADEDRHQDAHDFILLVKVNPVIDLDTLATLAELVYDGGGKAVVQYVTDIRAGKKINV